MIFLGSLFQKKDEKKVLRLSQGQVSNASNKFQWNLLEGLIQTTELQIINVLPVGIYPKQYAKLLLKSKLWKWKNDDKNIELGGINLPFLKQISRYLLLVKELYKRLRNNPDDNKVIIYSTYLPFLIATSHFKKKIEITLIVPDIPKYADLNNTTFIRRFLRSINNKIIEYYLRKIDNFIILTEAMKEPLKVGKRPYLVLEGISDVSISDEVCEQPKIDDNNGKNIIMYAGTLHYQYGILNLVEAFSRINKSDYELWICGKGEASEEIKKAAKLDSRIKFFGFIPLSEAKKLQNQASLLVNPRTDKGEYTKYSFPSKTLEYLSIGKPILMFKLDGIPNEYDEYLNYFTGYSIETMSNNIIAICEYNIMKVNKKAKEGKQFVKEKKSPVAQANRIMDFIKNGD